MCFLNVYYFRITLREYTLQKYYKNKKRDKEKFLPQ